MAESITIYCVNDGKCHSISAGTTLGEIAGQLNPKTEKDMPVLAALADKKLKELSYKVDQPMEIEFIGYYHPDGRRCYLRSLCFVLQKVVADMYPDKVLVVDHSLPSGLYCEIKESRVGDDRQHPVYFATDEEITQIEKNMRKVVLADLPFVKKKIFEENAEKIFLSQHQPEKAALLHTTDAFVTSVYSMDGRQDTFYGPLVPSTGLLKKFALSAFGNGFILQPPMNIDFNRLLPMKRQSKIAGTLKAYSDWCEILGIYGVGSLNKAIQDGNAVNIINISEAMQEREYARIADQIYARRSQVKVVFIAGPSSSGKTSSSLRLALELNVLGLNPKVIELDNYFKNREDTPKDKDGNYDFEALGAMDLPYLNQQINDLLDGKEVVIPKFDFVSGNRAEGKGTPMKLGEKDILIMEGIHALNPEMSSAVDDSRIFRVYASALTSLNLDENNNISTSDNRLLRRMVRDNRVRGITPEETIGRWDSVRKGESHNIFPFQENADAIFNSALIFELPMLRYYAEPLLRRIPRKSPAYTEAVRLLKFLGYITPLTPAEIAAIPPTSIMREFIGGQTL